MAPLSHPLQFLLLAPAGWINQHQRDVIDYLRTENRVLREHLGPRRLRFTDDQRVRLAAKAKTLRRRVLQEIDTIVSPDTLLAWHRHVIACASCSTIGTRCSVRRFARRSTPPVWRRCASLPARRISMLTPSAMCGPSRKPA